MCKSHDEYFDKSFLFIFVIITINPKTLNICADYPVLHDLNRFTEHRQQNEVQNAGKCTQNAAKLHNKMTQKCSPKCCQKAQQIAV